MNLEVKAKVEANHQAAYGIVNIVESPTIKEIVWLLARSPKKCKKDNHFKSVCKSTDRCDASINRQRPKKGKGKRFHGVNEQKDEVMDDLADQVQSLFYNDVHFDAVNMRMHTSIKCETPDCRTTSQTFKIDTGADGNLMPIGMFSKLFPQVNLDALSRMIEKGVTLFVYNNTPIRQFGTCSIRLSFKGRSSMCKFFVVEHETAVVGITDSEKLKLIKVNLTWSKG